MTNTDQFVVLFAILVLFIFAVIFVFLALLNKMDNADAENRALQIRIAALELKCREWYDDLPEAEWIDDTKDEDWWKDGKRPNWEDER